MALRRPFTAEDWDAPFWPTRRDATLPESIVFDPRADELVIRFAGTARRPEVVEPLAAPGFPCANVIADDDTGEIIGVQIDGLRRAALSRYPTWAAVAEPGPPPAAVARLITDVHDLFVRYGVVGNVWENGSLPRGR